MPKKHNFSLLQKETLWMSQLLLAFLITAMSGLVTYVISGEGVWKQWLYLVHTFAGLYLSIIIFPYIFIHFKRTLVFRRIGVFFVGLVLQILIMLLIASGVCIAFYGQQESLRWVFQGHVYLSFLVLFLMALHLWIHRVSFPKQRKKTEKDYFATIPLSLFRRTWIGLFIVTLIVCVGIFSYSHYSSLYNDEAVVKPYEKPYGKHPFRPSQTETLTGSFLDERRLSRSNKCGACHQQIVEEWQASLHGQAASDKTYEKNIKFLVKEKGIASARYCEGCHAPVALLSGQLTEGGWHGGIKNTTANIEGISCMSCHGIDKIEHLRGVASYRMNPMDNYLFADRDDVFSTMLHNFLIRLHPQEHRKEMARSVSQSPQMCATCHVQFMDKDVNGWGWIQMQDDYTGWLKSPYSGQSEQNFAHKDIVRCQDCHMPLVKGQDPSSDKNGYIRSHRYPGSNTAIPWLNGDKKQFEITKKFLQSNKVRVDIEEPNRDEAIRSKTFVNSEILKGTETPYYYYMGEEVSLNVIVSNIAVGHDFPGGSIDINQVWVSLRVTDAQNKVIYESGKVDKNQIVDAKAQFYRSLLIDRKGNTVWKHDLFNMTGRSYKKVIKSGGSDVIRYTFKIPYWVKGPLSVSAIVRYRKFNQHYAEWALDHKGIELPIIDMARDTLSIPIRYYREKE